MSVHGVTQAGALLADVAGEGARHEGKDAEALRQAAREFESIFLRQLFAQMRKTNESLGASQGLGADIYGGMFEERVAEMSSEQGGVGLADILIESWGVAEEESRLEPVEEDAFMGDDELEVSSHRESAARTIIALRTKHAGGAT